VCVFGFTILVGTITHKDIKTRKVSTIGDILLVPTRKKSILGLGVRLRAKIRVKVRIRVMS
jgi:hypothetical protein